MKKGSHETEIKSTEIDNEREKNAWIKSDRKMSASLGKILEATRYFT